MAGVKFQKEFTLARSVGSIFITRKKNRLRFKKWHFRALKFRIKISLPKFEQ